MADNIETAPQAWTVTLAGREIALVPSVSNLVAIEALTGCTILSLVEASSNGAVTIEQMALIALALADVSTDGVDPLFGRDKKMLDVPMMMRPIVNSGAVQGAIVEAGIMQTLPRLVVPIALALAGKTTAAGALKSEA